MDLTDFLPIISALIAHKWLVAVVVLIALLRKLLGPSSSLLPTISPEARNVIVSALSLVGGAVAAIDAGKSIGIAIQGAVISGVAGGLLDAVVTLFFAHSQAPAWIKIPLRIIDDVAQSEANRPQDPPGPSGGTTYKPVVIKVDPAFKGDVTKSLRTALARRLALAVAFAVTLVFGASVAGCAWFKAHEQDIAPPAQQVEQCWLDGAAAGKSFAEIALGCGLSEAELLVKLLESTDPAVKASKAYAEAVSMRRAALAHPGDAGTK